MKEFLKKLWKKTLWYRVKVLEKAVAEKPTISQRTTEKEDKEVTPSQILDEWFNGGKDE